MKAPDSLKPLDYVIIGVIIIVIGFVGYYLITADTTIKTKHFENENISFDYPETWTVTVADHPKNYMLSYWGIKIESPSDSLVFVVITDIGPFGKSNMTGNSIKIDNITSYLNTSDADLGKIKYSFTKNNRTYEVYIHADNDNGKWDFNEYQDYYNIILNSIHIKT